MKNFLIGFLLGGLLLGAVSARGFGVEITGDFGEIHGYSVLHKGEEVCKDPYASTELKVIRCD